MGCKFWGILGVLCTNINNGIGTIIIELIKSILTDKPIRLASTLNSEKFYLKKDFVKLFGSIMEYSIIKKIELLS